MAEETPPIAYQPFFCEENVWKLAQRAELVAHRAEVVFVFGPERPGARVACWFQAAADPGEAVLWDYHVVLAEHRPDTGVVVWDLDTRLGLPCPAALWIAATFQDPARVPARYQPRFRVAAAEVFVRDFASDRSHMRDARGRYRKPPPPWDPPGAPGMNLDAWRTGAPGGPGQVLDRAGLMTRWGLRRP